MWRPISVFTANDVSRRSGPGAETMDMRLTSSFCKPYGRPIADTDPRGTATGADDDAVVVLVEE